jgi:hypothetical protein
MNKEQIQLEGIAAQVQKLREGQSSIDGLLAQTRACDDLRRQLPPAFSTVLDNLTDRLQASALFTEESCSFSRQDLLDSLQLWLDKARERVDRQAG